MPNLSGYLHTAAGVGINAADVAVFTVATGADETTGTGSATATTTTNASGYWATASVAEGVYDVRITSGTTILWARYQTDVQLREIETATLKIRNPADTFVYDILPAAITANRTLTLPLITGTDTLAVLGLAQTFTADITLNDSVNLTLGTGGDADIDYDGTDMVINTLVVGTGDLVTHSQLVWGTGVAVTAGDYSIGRDADGTNQLHLNVPTGAAFELSVNDTAEYALNATQADFNSNNIVNLGTLNTHTVPAGTDTLVGKATTDTFTNKTYDASGTGNSLSNVGASEIEIGIITGHSELSAGPAETDELLISDAGTFKKINAVELLNPENFTALSATPASTDEVFINDGGVGKKITVDNLTAYYDAATATLTNKTFDANGTGNSLSNVDVADLANGTDGELITWDANAAPAAVAVGTAGQVLTSNGVGAAPTFQTGGGVSQATQAAIEAETNENTYLPPDLLKHSPGVAKVFCRIANSGSLDAGSYNVASVTDTDTGDRTINFTTNFSSTNYSPVTAVDEFSGTHATNTSDAAVGSVRLRITDTETNMADRATATAIYGDQ